jgi:transposase
MNGSNGNIFSSKNQELIRIFEDAGRPAKVLCVPLDYAKRWHTALFCDGTGKILKEAFDVENSPKGLDYLLNHAKRTMRARGIHHKHVFFGGEDCGTYSLNFIHGLQNHSFPVFGVHAADAKKQRENMQASTDKLALLGISQKLLNRQGHLIESRPSREDSLRIVGRQRHAKVSMRTGISNRTHALVDQLFPGFLNERKSGIPSFSKASLYLMEDRFSPRQIRRRNERALAERLADLGLRKTAERAARLKQYAGSVLPGADGLTGALQSSLSAEVAVYRGIQDCIRNIEREIALLLAALPGAFLTSIPGIGLAYSSEFAGEVGPVEKQNSVRRLSSYTGIVPSTFQTGGPESPPVSGTVSRRCNHYLKDVVLRSSQSLYLLGPPELKEDFSRRAASGQNALFGVGRRYIRLAMSLMRNCECYIPADLRETRDRDDMRIYYRQMWPKLLETWKGSGALHFAFDSANPLGQWRECIQAIHDIKLPLPKKRKRG